ncbi:MAG: NADH-quinone oxidoreductase subunit NuoB [Chloroflexota bacterium]|nr:NADH-quinone oxidoreductase subunit NuoB [Chloroflexota bacterium]MDQ6905306.1 NADH-quinone oxidoreductase subunit NuoB [Chloroflexota bacterium]
MLNVLRESLRTKRRTIAYPDVPDLAPPAYRGRPEIDPHACQCAGDCVAVCPSQAITLTQIAPGTERWQLDLARCVFCGLCAEVCPHDALTMTNDYELAARSRGDLITGVTFGPDAAAVPDTRATPDAERLHGRIQGLLKRSLHIRHCDAGSENSCDWEINALLNPVYDVQRLGIDFVASPRHADLLLVTGAVTRHLEPALRATYAAMPAPRLVVAVGDEACSGGILQGSYAVLGGVDRCLPVDVYIPGDPPRPQALIQGLLVALDRLAPIWSSSRF